MNFSCVGDYILDIVVETEGATLSRVIYTDSVARLAVTFLMNCTISINYKVTRETYTSTTVTLSDDHGSDLTEIYTLEVYTARQSSSLEVCRERSQICQYFGIHTIDRHRQDTSIWREMRYSSFQAAIINHGSSSRMSSYVLAIRLWIRDGIEVWSYTDQSLAVLYTSSNDVHRV
jgi:hypothetical protein